MSGNSKEAKLPSVVRKPFPRILLVHPHEPTRRQLVVQLTSKRFVVETAADAKSTLNKHRYPGYHDAIFINHTVGELSGTFIAQELRKKEAVEAAIPSQVIAQQERIKAQYFPQPKLNDISGFDEHLPASSSTKSALELLTKKLAMRTFVQTVSDGAQHRANPQGSYKARSLIFGLCDTPEQRSQMTSAVVKLSDAPDAIYDVVDGIVKEKAIKWPSAFDTVFRYPLTMHLHFLEEAFVSFETIPRLTQVPTHLQIVQLISHISEHRAPGSLSFGVGREESSLGRANPVESALLGRIKQAEDESRAAASAVSEAEYETDRANANVHRLRSEADLLEELLAYEKGEVNRLKHEVQQLQQSTERSRKEFSDYRSILSEHVEKLVQELREAQSSPKSPVQAVPELPSPSKKEANKSPKKRRGKRSPAPEIPTFPRIQEMHDSLLRHLNFMIDENSRIRNELCATQSQLYSAQWERDILLEKTKRVKEDGQASPPVCSRRSSVTSIAPPESGLEDVKGNTRSMMLRMRQQRAQEHARRRTSIGVSLSSGGDQHHASAAKRKTEVLSCLRERSEAALMEMHDRQSRWCSLGSAFSTAPGLTSRRPISPTVEDITECARQIDSRQNNFSATEVFASKNSNPYGAAEPCTVTVEEWQEAFEILAPQRHFVSVALTQHKAIVMDGIIEVLKLSHHSAEANAHSIPHRVHSIMKNLTLTLQHLHDMLPKHFLEACRKSVAAVAVKLFPMKQEIFKAREAGKLRFCVEGSTQTAPTLDLVREHLLSEKAMELAAQVVLGHAENAPHSNLLLTSSMANGTASPSNPAGTRQGSPNGSEREDKRPRSGSMTVVEGFRQAFSDEAVC